jgi:beta-galactosidase
MQDFRVEKLKEMGANAWRCSHNPPMPELLDACDRLGMLVMDENRKLGDSPEVLDQVKSMVLRDRNHPSIILWSLCNEEKRQGSPEGRRLGQAMKKVILDFDTTRPVTAAMNGGYEGKGLSALVDVQGFNYNIGKYDAYHRAHPRQPLFGSETASAVGTRGVYENDRERGYVSAYDVNAPDWGDSAEKAWRALGEREFMAGGFVWTGFDYKGEPTPYGWPCVNSHFGIMDICGFPKDSYYYYQAWWSGKPVLHLLPHWTWPGKEGQPLAVRAVAPLGHVEWTPQYEPGVLSAKGFQAGRLVAQDQADTTGPPAQIGLKPFKTRLLADGEDVVPVEVSVLDAMGRVVPVAGNLVAFSVSGAGAIAGVGNGDPSCHEADQAGSRSAFNGRCLVLVRAGENAGPITLTAKAGGLKGAAAFLTALTSTAAPR